MELKPGTYKAANNLDGYTMPIFSTTKLSKRLYALGTQFSVTAVQENVPNSMIFGRLTNGDWVLLLKNGKPQATFIGSPVVTTPPQIPPATPPTTPPVVPIAPVHVLKINQVGQVSVDGLPYE